MRSPRRSIVASLLLLPAGLIGCSGELDGNEADNGRLVLYVSADDFLARQIIAEFEKESGLRVSQVGDTELNKTTGIANRIRAERDNPQADVFWSSEAFMMIQLAEEGLLEPFESDVVRDWPAPLTGDDRRWHGFGSRARVIVYSPTRIRSQDLPDTWLELADAKWQGRIAMADPRFGTTRGHLGAMRAHWGEEQYRTFLNGLMANEVLLITSGNAGVVQAVASGEADLGMTDTDDVWAAQRNGLDVELIYPAHGQPGVPGAGTLLIPNTVALIKGLKNRVAAEQFVAFLLGDRVARLLAESDSHNIPVQGSIAAEFPQFAVANALEIELSDAAAHMDDAVEMAMELLDGEQ